LSLSMGHRFYCIYMTPLSQESGKVILVRKFLLRMTTKEMFEIVFLL
jgi:hypothetical protein